MKDSVMSPEERVERHRDALNILPQVQRNQPTVNCPVPRHPPECLCDVSIAEATPINYGLTDLWHGEAIARAMNLGVPWSRTDVADFGESLLKAYDIWSRQNRGEPLEQEVLRMKVRDLLQTGVSITVVPRLLDLDWKTVIEAMTNNVPAAVWEWDESEWLVAEAIIHEHFANFGADTLIEMLGGDMCRDSIYRLAEWYGVKVNENGEDRLARLKDMLRSGLHPLDATAQAEAEGIVVNSRQMYMIRKRLSERGEVPSVLPRRLSTVR